MMQVLWNCDGCHTTAETPDTDEPFDWHTDRSACFTYHYCDECWCDDCQRPEKECDC